MKLFNYDSPFMQFMARVWDFMILNLLWVVCSIPIITFGASTSAYYYCMMKIVRGTDTGILLMFFHAFKENLKQGIFITLTLLVTAVFFIVDLELCSSLNGYMFGIVEILLYALIGLFVVVVIYIFPVLAQFNNTTKNTIKNAFFMGVRHLGKTIFLVIVTIVPIMFAFLMPYYFFCVLPIWLFGGTSFLVYLKSRLFVKIFNQYIEN